MSLILRLWKYFCSNREEPDWTSIFTGLFSLYGRLALFETITLWDRCAGALGWCCHRLECPIHGAVIPHLPMRLPRRTYELGTLVRSVSNKKDSTAYRPVGPVFQAFRMDMLSGSRVARFLGQATVSARPVETGAS